NQAAKDIAQRSLESSPLPAVMVKGGSREVKELSQSFQHMTQQLQASFAALQTSEEEFRRLFTSIDEGFCVVEVLFDDRGNPLDHRVLKANPGLERHSGIANPQGRLASELVPGIEPLWNELYTQVIRTGEPIREEIYSAALDRWFDVQVSRLEEASLNQVAVVLSNISDRKATEQSLLVSEEKFRQLAENIEEVFWLTDAVVGETLFVSAAYEKIWGRSRDSLYADPTSFLEAVHPDDRPLLTPGLTVRDRPFEVEYRIIQPDGTVRWIWDRGFPIFDPSGRLIRRVGLAQDITQRKQAEFERTRLVDVLESSLNEIYIFNSNTLAFEYGNRGALENLGYSLDQLQRMTPLNIKPELSAADFDALLAPLRQGTVSKVNYETVHQRADGSRYPVEVYLQRPQYNGKSLFLAIVLDITDRKQAEEQLVYRALHDSLTDLPNRTLLTSRLEAAIQQSQRSTAYHFAVMFLDLDQFKLINDSLGHLVGDKLLLTVAHKLQGLIRPTDLAARLGGDEFVILLDQVPNLDAVIRMAERLLSEFEGATEIDGRNVFITTSMGIVWGTPAYMSATDLLRDADIALYRAKASGRGTYELFDVEMHVQAVKRMTLDHDLRVATDQQSFITYYQPIVDLNTQRLVGVEALIRWPHPTRGFIPPADFIPVAEETGLILPISQWILRSACEQIATWQRQYPALADLRVSVNLSGQDLRQPTLVETVRQTLAQAGLPATSLTLEITESMLIDDIETTIKRLSQLRDLGIRISIDDFGTGYSSLSYLYNLPADYLKIDQSFVSDMRPGGKNYKIVQAVISLSDQLQLAAIAEGIETVQQLEWLKKLGCELGQGYLLASPMPPEAVTAFFAKQSLKRHSPYLA
ncbi:MAG: EAL domain-containing protein, partial [Nodosilinea sp.]